MDKAVFFWPTVLALPAQGWCKKIYHGIVHCPRGPTKIFICISTEVAEKTAPTWITIWAMCKKWVAAKQPKMGRFQKIFGQKYLKFNLSRGHFYKKNEISSNRDHWTGAVFRENWCLPNGPKWADVEFFLTKFVWNPISMGVIFMKKIEMFSNWRHRVWAVSAKQVYAKRPKKVWRKKKLSFWI